MTEQAVVTINSSDFSIFSLINSADAAGKLVIIILVLASVWSWAVIIGKFRQFTVAKFVMRKFEQNLTHKNEIAQFFEKAKSSTNNPLALIVLAAESEVQNNKILLNSVDKENVKNRVMNAMCLQRDKIIMSLEARIGSLATIGSSSPFIGLFGTVWGIMHSFSSIAVSKNASLAVVAPGIAEALLATGIGLFVAIPATIFYNYLVSEIDHINAKMDQFIGYFGINLSRAIDEGKLNA